MIHSVDRNFDNLLCSHSKQGGTRSQKRKPYQLLLVRKEGSGSHDQKIANKRLKREPHSDRMLLSPVHLEAASTTTFDDPFLRTGDKSILDEIRYLLW